MLRQTRRPNPQNSAISSAKVEFSNQAQKFWHFLGPAFKYERSIKLLSDRLPKSMTMMVSLPMIRGGDTWNISLEFVVKGDEKQRGQGFGLWLSQKDVFQDIMEFVADSASEEHVLGMGVEDV